MRTMDEDFIAIPDFEGTNATVRYIGEDLGVPMDVLTPEQQSVLSDTYQMSLALLGCCRKYRQSGTLAGFLSDMDALNWKCRVEVVKSDLLISEDQVEALPHLRKIIHDLRGGAFSNLILMLDLIQMLGERLSLWHVERLFFLVRDHLKIMRNCIVDIDVEARQADLQPCYHSTALLREKWDGYTLGQKQVRYRSEADVDIASCCMEFSTLDRVVYNMVNNALRHTRDAMVDLYVEPVQTSEDLNMRIVTANAVDDAHKQQLEERFGEKLHNLFKGGFTTTGSGVGLSICTECVKNAYKLKSNEQTIERGFVGAHLKGNLLYVWVHWPQMAD